MAVVPDPAGPPNQFPVIQYQDCVQYTDVGQFDWINQRLIATYNNDPLLHFDTDGTTLVWFAGSYRMALNEWLWNGQTVMTDDQVKTFLRPLPDWPASTP